MIAETGLFPEYEHGFEQLFMVWHREMMAALDEFFAQIPTTEIDEVSRHASEGEVGYGSQSHGLSVHSEVTLDMKAVISGNIDHWSCMVVDSAQLALDSLMPQFFEEMRKSTAEAGRAVQTSGKTLDHDTLMDALEKIDFDIDDQGRPTNLNLVVSPEQKRQLEELGPPSVKQLERLRSIVANRRKKRDAERRVRRLD